MRFEKLELENFLSFRELDYSFGRSPLLIQGLNLTEVSQKTNGTGKSSIQSGLEFCCTATNSRGVRDKDLVSYGKKAALAKLKISCDIRKQYIHIEWTIKVKGSNSGFKPSVK